MSLLLCLTSMATRVGPSHAYTDLCVPLGWEDGVLQDMEGDGSVFEKDLLLTNSDMEADGDEAEDGASPSPDDDFSLNADSGSDERSGGISLEVEAALVKALASKSLTPILKEELRCKIQLKRLQHGQDEMTPDFSKKTSSMSLEEIMKRNKKMEQNRMSAHKSRQRQKSLEKTIKDKCDVLQRQNIALEKQVKLLRKACVQATQWLDQHQTCLHTSVSRASSFILPSQAGSSFPGIRFVPGSASVSLPSSGTFALP